MAIYYLSSVDGSDASDGLSWNNAFATFEYAVETASAAASGPHLLYVDSAHSESLSADTTITAAGDIRIFCINRGTGALATTAAIGVQSTNYAITFGGAFIIYVYGISFRTGTGSSTKTITISTDGQHYEIESGSFVFGTGTGIVMQLGSNSATGNSYIKLKNCSVKLGNTGNSISLYNGLIELENVSLDAAGSSPTNLFGATARTGRCQAEGCDFSHVGTNSLFANFSGTGTYTATLANCQIGSGVVLAAATTVLNKGQTSVWLYNCASGDTHYAIAHYDAFGETTVTTTIYANDGAAYDGTNKCSWKIVTTANCSYYTPYVSPWMDVYHSGTSAISPYLEALRSGSTTKYQNDEVWGEFSYQGTSGSTKATFVNDRMTLLGTAADQTASSLGASDWTGEDATNNAYMKLEAGSITPAEIGHIRARVVVGEPSITVYVDPKIRGLS